MAKTVQRRAVVNISPQARLKLSKMVLVVRATGVACFQQELLGAMIEYFDKRRTLLKEVV